MMLHNVNNKQVSRLNPGSLSLCSKPRRKFVHLICVIRQPYKPAFSLSY